MAQSEGEAPEEKFQTQVPRQGLQAVVYSRMKSLPASAQGGSALAPALSSQRKRYRSWSTA